MCWLVFNQWLITFKLFWEKCAFFLLPLWRSEDFPYSCTKTVIIFVSLKNVFQTYVIYPLIFRFVWTKPKKNVIITVTNVSYPLESSYTGLLNYQISIRHKISCFEIWFKCKFLSKKWRVIIYTWCIVFVFSFATWLLIVVVFL